MEDDSEMWCFDIWIEIAQYVPPTEWLHCLQLVCKQWTHWVWEPRLRIRERTFFEKQSRLPEGLVVQSRTRKAFTECFKCNECGCNLGEVFTVQKRKGYDQWGSYWSKLRVDGYDTADYCLSCFQDRVPEQKRAEFYQYDISQPLDKNQIIYGPLKWNRAGFYLNIEPVSRYEIPAPLIDRCEGSGSLDYIRCFDKLLYRPTDMDSIRSWIILDGGLQRVPQLPLPDTDDGPSVNPKQVSVGWMVNCNTDSQWYGNVWNVLRVQETKDYTSHPPELLYWHSFNRGFSSVEEFIEAESKWSSANVEDLAVALEGNHHPMEGLFAGYWRLQQRLPCSVSTTDHLSEYDD